MLKEELILFITQWYNKIFRIKNIEQFFEETSSFLDKTLKPDFIFFYISKLEKSFLKSKLKKEIETILKREGGAICENELINLLKRETELKKINLYHILNRTRKLGCFILGWKREKLSSKSEKILNLLVNSIILSISNIILNEEILELSLKLTSLKEELTLSNRSGTIEEMTRAIAHELRSPLATIYNSLSQIKRRYEERGFIEKNSNIELLLEAGLEEIKRINNLIKDLIIFSSPGRLNLHQIVNIKELIENVIEDVKEDPCFSENIDINFKYKLPYNELTSDYDRLKFALYNLVINGVQAIKERGNIDIVTYLKSHYLIIEVKDNGEGIEPSYMKKIFEPFFTTKHTGTGLGLSIVKRIIEDHGGKIEVESSLGKGTTFTIFLPFRPLIG